jgi:hypothetical protein
MFKKFIEQIPLSDTLAIISLLIFFLVFLGIIYFTMKTGRKYREKMKNLPLDSSNRADEQNGKINGENTNG